MSGTAPPLRVAVRPQARAPAEELEAAVADTLKS